MADAPLYELGLPTLELMDMSGAPPFDMFEFNSVGGSRPLVTMVTPSAPGGIGTQDQFRFTVSLGKPATIARVIIWVRYPDPLSTVEVAYDSTAFTPDYSGGSALVDNSTLADTILTFAVKRNGGWPSSPRIFVHANSNNGMQTEAP